MNSELALMVGHGPVHFIGIGGISMSGLAQILLHRGIPVTGSDRVDGPNLEKLRTLGADIHVPHQERYIRNQTLVVHTAAIPEDNPEILAARARNIPIMDRATFLGMLAAGYTHALAVSGTHGKTTTTGMLAEVLMAAGTDPTVHIGGMLNSIGGNTRLGGQSHFVMEACEYKNSFLQFYPSHALILNIEADHLDFFRDLDDVLDSFSRYLQNLSPSGVLVMNLDDDGCNLLASRTSHPFIGFTLGTTVSDIVAAAAEKTTACYSGTILSYEGGCARLNVTLKGRCLATLRLSVPGQHNASNALGCFALCHQAGIPPETIASGLAAFTGTGRRFECRGDMNGVTVIDDYAHHPTEVNATLKTARSVSSGKICCIFQPHTFTRTHALLNDFAHALSAADNVIVMDIYAAREPDSGLVHARDLVNAIQALGTQASYAGDHENASILARNNSLPGDIILVMGAGDVNLVSTLLLHSPPAHPR